MTVKKPDDNELLEIEILNKGLELAMEFGENWLQPIQSRLSQNYGKLTDEMLDQYNKVCTHTMDDGHLYVYNFLTELKKNSKRISQAGLKEMFDNYMLEKYGWIDSDNLDHLFSQSLYYTWKDGLNSSIE